MIVRALFITGLVMCETAGVVQGQKKPTPTASPKILECIKSGDVACVTQFLGSGGNANAVDERGLPLLNIAAETKSAALVRLLISAGGDVNDVGSGDATPLCRAVLFGRKEIFQILLDAGAKADVICDGDHGDSALMEAMSGAMFSEEPFDMMLKSEELPERDAPAADYLDIARMLLARGVDVNVVAKCDVGESALMYAVMAANLEMVKALMAHGAMVKEESPVLDVLRQLETEYERAKWTPVPALSRQQAAMVDWTEKTRPRREEIVRLLKTAGAKESERDDEPFDYKENAEDYAKEAFRDSIERNDIKDFERLVAAYINHPLGATVLPEALRVAVNHQSVEMVELLLKRGVNPNLPSTAVKYTPLMQAASSADIELVKLLLDAGAELNARDEQGRTALDEAERYTHSSEKSRAVAAFLLEQGARRGNEKR